MSLPSTPRGPQPAPRDRDHHRVGGGGVTGARERDIVVATGRRQFRLPRFCAVLLIAVASLATVWTAATSVYFLFQDDVLGALVQRQRAMQHAYEDRIAHMKAQIDRLSSRQLLDQELVEKRLETLVRRQATLENRHATLLGLGEPAAAGAPAARERAAVPVPTPRPDRDSAQGGPVPSAADPLSRIESGFAPLERPRRLDPAALPRDGDRASRFGAAGPIDGDLSRVARSLDRLEELQMQKLARLEDEALSTARRLRGVAVELGLDVRGAPAPAASGGPFVPVTRQGGAFDTAVGRIQTHRSDVARMRTMFQAVPVRRPLDDDAEMTSGFGVRIDPFLRTPAMHTGVDWRGPIGEPVRATATGRVAFAGRDGGYGMMVEIDHGNGLSTRYAHLSSILVTEGQAIRIGQVVGRLGSTGRSTGPHLHYETRVNGEAVDPLRFLRAGTRLDGAL